MDAASTNSNLDRVQCRLAGQVLRILILQPRISEPTSTTELGTASHQNSTILLSRAPVSISKDCIRIFTTTVRPGSIHPTLVLFKRPPAVRSTHSITQVLCSTVTMFVVRISRYSAD